MPWKEFLAFGDNNYIYDGGAGGVDHFGKPVQAWEVEFESLTPM